MLRILAAGILVAALGACTAQPGPKEGAGTLLGAIGGGVAGAQFGSGTGQLAATGAGTLLGALIGAEAGRSLDRADVLYFERSRSSPRRQVPTPGFTRAAPSGYGASPVGQYQTVRPVSPAHSPSCRRLDEGFNPVFVCQDDFGRWFVVQ
jgi:surface antigen